ncbi:hypothetical protein M8J77_023693 [Diaphorina citri]|nr:hypothetical protein M8J77_023693 [Diaphorina citri]
MQLLPSIRCLTCVICLLYEDTTFYFYESIKKLLTGHDCLAQHLHKINIKDSPICPLCSLNAPMNSSHLNFCPALEASNDIVGKYWDARGKMA